MEYEKLARIAVQHGICGSCTGPMDLGWGWTPSQYSTTKSFKCDFCRWVELFGKRDAVRRERLKFLEMYAPDVCPLCQKSRNIDQWVVCSLIIVDGEADIMCMYCNRSERGGDRTNTFVDAFQYKHGLSDEGNVVYTRRQSYLAKAVRRIRREGNEKQLLTLLKLRLIEDDLSPRMARAIRKEVRELGGSSWLGGSSCQQD